MRHRRVHAISSTLLLAFGAAVVIAGCRPAYVLHISPGVVGKAYVPAPAEPRYRVAPSADQFEGAFLKTTLPASISDAEFDAHGLRVPAADFSGAAAEFVREHFGWSGDFRSVRRVTSRGSDGPCATILGGDWISEESGTTSIVVAVVDRPDGARALLVPIAPTAEAVTSPVHFKAFASGSSSDGVDWIQPVFWPAEDVSAER